MTEKRLRKCELKRLALSHYVTSFSEAVPACRQEPNTIYAPPYCHFKKVNFRFRSVYKDCCLSGYSMKDEELEILERKDKSENLQKKLTLEVIVYSH